MLVIDAQVHVYERNHAGRPWQGMLHGPAEMTGEQMIAAMDEAGVDAAVLVSTWALYKDDASYAFQVRDAYPDRFAVVRPLDPSDPAAPEKIAELARTPGGIAVRIISMPPITGPNVNLVFPDVNLATDPGVRAVFAAAARHSIPVNLTCIGRMDQAAELARAHPSCRIVIDHMGLRQPFERPVPKGAFDDLSKVLELARFDNVAMKASGVCSLSQNGYPYDDIWEPLARTIDAFGLDRCMWGTDWTRALSMTSYRESVDGFRCSDRLTEDEKQKFLGRTLLSIYDWKPAAA
jgi:predicted TIM-barrel fold metal-dependent hydrolase